jgi:hypothetical protein
VIDGGLEYRGVAYSIKKLHEGLFQWKLHPNLEPPWTTLVHTGHTSGIFSDAVAAARRAIDLLIDGTPEPEPGDQ